MCFHSVKDVKVQFNKSMLSTKIALDLIELYFTCGQKAV